MIIHGRENVLYQLATNPVMIEEARKLRHDVYLKTGYIKEGYPNGIIPDEKDSISDFLVAVAQEEEVVGIMRLTPVDSKYDLFEHWRGNMLPGAEEKISAICCTSIKSVELGSLAVKKSNGPRRVSWGLYKSTFLYSLIKGIDYWFIGMDSRALRALEMLGWNVERLGKPIDYVGSITELGVMEVKSQLGEIFNRNPRYYNYIAN